MSVIVDKVLGLGDDQLASQFIVQFPEGLPGGGDTDALSLRLDESVDPPEESVGTYDIKFRGMTIPKTNMQEQTSKEVEFIARLDKNWDMYTALRNTYEITYNPVKGTALGDSSARFLVEVQALDTENNVVKTISFKNSKIKSLKINTFEHSSEDPTKITFSILYGSMEIS